MDAYRVAAATDGTPLGAPFLAASLEDASVVLNARAHRPTARSGCPYRLEVLVEAEPDFWADTTVRAAS